MEIKLVKWNYDSFPEGWKKQNPNLFHGCVFACFGEVKGMKGHSYCQDIKTGLPTILDSDNLLELTEEEL
jgi:hypothetical protein